MTRPGLPASVVPMFSLDALAMLVGKGEGQMRALLRTNAAEFPEPRYVPAYVVGNHAGRNKVRVFTTEDVVAIRAALEVIKARKRAAWEARRARKYLRQQGRGVDPARWRSRGAVLGPAAPGYGERPDGGSAA